MITTPTDFPDFGCRPLTNTGTSTTIPDMSDYLQDPGPSPKEIRNLQIRRKELERQLAELTADEDTDAIWLSLKEELDDVEALLTEMDR